MNGFVPASQFSDQEEPNVIGNESSAEYIPGKYPVTTDPYDLSEEEGTLDNMNDHQMEDGNGDIGDGYNSQHLGNYYGQDG